MKELEMREAVSQHRAELAARDNMLQGLRDRDHENRATIDLQRKVPSILAARTKIYSTPINIELILINHNLNE